MKIYSRWSVFHADRTFYICPYQNLGRPGAPLEDNIILFWHHQVGVKKFCLTARHGKWVCRFQLLDTGKSGWINPVFRAMNTAGV
jgi:hypothetical protein